MRREQQSVLGWIYSFEDYCQRYDLTDDDFAKPILDFPGQVSSFNALATQKGAKVLSAGPIFEKSNQDMATYVDSILQKNSEELKAHPQRHSVIQSWTASAAIFKQDYVIGKSQGRYLSIVMNPFPFTTHQFGLALCSHLLFQPVWSLGVSPIHLLESLCDVAEEVRLYPLLDAAGKITDDLGPLMLSLQEKNYGVEVREVPDQYQKGGNAMLRIWAQACIV